MTAADLLADLQARGIILEVHGDRLRYRPADRVTEADLAALRHLKAGVIELLTGPGNHGSDPPAPTVACLACNTLAWTWTPDWPEPSTGCWLCATCTSRPSPSLRELVAQLSATDRARLDAEVAAGDVLAGLILAALVQPTGRPSVDRLRAIADVKRELGGRVVQDTGEPLTPARELFPGTSGITNEKVNAEPVQGRLEARRAR